MSLPAAVVATAGDCLLHMTPIQEEDNVILSFAIIRALSENGNSTCC